MWTHWGVGENVLGTGENVLDFFRTVLDEVMDVSPSPYVHIGGDEVPTTEWERSPRARARAACEGLEYLTHPRLCALADRVWAGGRPPLVPPHRAPPTEASAQAGAVPKGSA